jgi:hypothetical protein
VARWRQRSWRHGEPSEWSSWAEDENGLTSVHPSPGPRSCYGDILSVLKITQPDSVHCPRLYLGVFKKGLRFVWHALRMICSVILSKEHVSVVSAVFLFRKWPCFIVKELDLCVKLFEVRPT